jgi:hypothetical protein
LGRDAKQARQATYLYSANTSPYTLSHHAGQQPETFVNSSLDVLSREVIVIRKFKAIMCFKAVPNTGQLFYFKKQQTFMVLPHQPKILLVGA